MALPSIMRKLFRNDGYGPLLKPEIIPFTSNVVSRASDVAASTKWVEDAFGFASLYVDPVAGNDSNDGLTASTAVKTIAQAVSLLQMRTGTGATVRLASGSYTENIFLSNINVHFVLLGNVSIAGNLRIELGSNVKFSGNHTLTISSTGYNAVYISSQSYVTFVVTQINLSASNTDSVITTGQNCALYFGGVLNVSGTNISSYAIRITGGSGCTFDKAVNITSSRLYGGLILFGRSFCYVGDSFTESGQFSGGSGFQVSDCSCVEFTANGSHTIYDGIVVARGSMASAESNITIICHNAKTCLDISNNAAYFQPSGNLALRNTSSSGWTLLSCDGSATFTMASSGTLSFNAPAVTHTVYCSRQSLIYVNANPTVTGTVSSGSRYRATVGGTISTGRGPNLFPGATAGTALAADYALYV